MAAQSTPPISLDVRLQTGRLPYHNLEVQLFACQTIRKNLWINTLGSFCLMLPRLVIGQRNGITIG